MNPPHAMRRQVASPWAGSTLLFSFVVLTGCAGDIVGNFPLMAAAGAGCGAEGMTVCGLAGGKPAVLTCFEAVWQSVLLCDSGSFCSPATGTPQCTKSAVPTDVDDSDAQAAADTDAGSSDALATADGADIQGPVNCNEASDCTDGNPCTHDGCSDGHCVHEAATGMACGMEKVCTWAGECTCMDAKTTGPTCEQCVDPKMAAPECTLCLDPKKTGPNCDQCADWTKTGATCDECADPAKKGPDCILCLDPKKTGANCELCVDAKKTGPACDQCLNPELTGPNCDQCVSGSGLPGCPCNSNSQCDSGACTETPEGQQCTSMCSSGCAAGFKCATVDDPFGGSGWKICVHSYARLCNPCNANLECQGPGNAGARCVDQGNAGAFCGTPCQVTEDCPAGYVCQDSKDLAGQASKQCVVKDGGTCTCSESAKQQELSTKCQIVTGDTQCEGKRTCLPPFAPGAPPGGGLSACTATNCGSPNP